MALTSLNAAEVFAVCRRERLGNADFHELSVPGDGVERCTQLVTHRGEKLRFRAIRPVGRFAGALGCGFGALASLELTTRGFVETRVVHGDRRPCRYAFNRTFRALGEDVRLVVAKEEPSQHFTGSPDDGNRQVTHDR
jgi:hypothetical protein